jgi:hypothetical protein
LHEPRLVGGRKHQSCQPEILGAWGYDLSRLDTQLGFELMSLVNRWVLDREFRPDAAKPIKIHGGIGSNPNVDQRLFNWGF